MTFIMGEKNRFLQVHSPMGLCEIQFPHFLFLEAGLLCPIPRASPEAEQVSESDHGKFSLGHSTYILRETCMTLLKKINLSKVKRGFYCEP